MRIASSRHSRVAWTAGAMVLLMITAGAQERDRAQTADQYKWNLADIYPTDAAWRTAKDRVAAAVPQIRQFQGKLATSAATLADALDKQAELDKELSRLYVYASLLADQDTRESGPEGMHQEMVQLAAAFNAQASYIEPEILKADQAKIQGFMAAEPRLKVYRFYLDDVARRAAHTLSDAEEKLLADSGPLAGTASNIFNILSNADFPYPSVTLSDGRTVKVDQAGYGELRALPNRADREKVMSAFFGALAGFSRTYGTTINGEVQKVAFVARSRKYPSAV